MSKDVRETIRIPSIFVDIIESKAKLLNISKNDAYKLVIYKAIEEELKNNAV